MMSVRRFGERCYFRKGYGDVIWNFNRLRFGDVIDITDFGVRGFANCSPQHDSYLGVFFGGAGGSCDYP